MALPIYLPAAAIAVLLVLIGITFLRAGVPRRPGRWLGVYLLLVGTGYVHDALQPVTIPLRSGGDAGHAWIRAVEEAHMALVVLDSLALLLFCLETTGTRVRWWMAAIYAVPPALLVGTMVASPYWPEVFPGSILHPPFMALYLAYYGTGFLLVAAQYARAGLGTDRRRLGFTYLWLGVIVIPRLALLPKQAGSGYLDRVVPGLLLAEVLGVLVMALGISAFVYWRSETLARPDARNRTVLLFGLLALVVLPWLMRLVPALVVRGGFIVFQWRWLVAAVVLSFGVLTQGLVMRPLRSMRLLPMAAMAAALLAAVALAAELLDQLPGIGTGIAFLAAGMIVTMAAAVPALLLWRAPGLIMGSFSMPGDRIRAERAAGAGTERLQQLHHLFSVEEEPSVYHSPGRSALYAGSVWLGRYEVKRLLGAGGQGRVWLAWDRHRREDVVMKEVLGRPAPNEVKALLRLQSPRLPRIHGYEHDGIASALIMEYVPGPTLNQRLAQGSLTSKEHRRLLREGKEALGALHSEGLVHGDIRAENLVIHPDRGLVVVDLGLATRGNATRTAMIDADSTRLDDLVRLRQALEPSP